VARISVRRRRRRVRLPGQLFAEVLLAVLLLAGLAIYWPSGPPGEPAAATAKMVGAAPGIFVDELPGRGVTAPGQIVPVFVPSASPVQLLIPSINIHPRVESVGVDRNGAMAVPHLYFEVAWYNAGPVPGDPGDAVIDGHAGYPDQPLVFGRLGSLRLGAKITVVLADGSKRAFSVTSVRSWPVGSHPTGLFQPDGPPRLSLITCSGDFNDKTKTYADRLVVEATYAGQD
jgi:hypothetical protein